LLFSKTFLSKDKYNFNDRPLTARDRSITSDNLVALSENDSFIKKGLSGTIGRSSTPEKFRINDKKNILDLSKSAIITKSNNESKNEFYIHDKSNNIKKSTHDKQPVINEQHLKQEEYKLEKKKKSHRKKEIEDTELQKHKHHKRHHKHKKEKRDKNLIVDTDSDDDLAPPTREAPLPPIVGIYTQKPIESKSGLLNSTDKPRQDNNSEKLQAQQDIRKSDTKDPKKIRN